MAFGFYKELICNSTHIGSDLTDLPAALTVVDSDIADTANGGEVTSSSGYDIAFFTDDMMITQIPHELISYVAATGALKVWIKFDPTAAADLTVYMFYGDSSITTDQSDITTTGTFSAYADGGFGFVCHLNEDPDVSEPNQPDSSGQGNYFFPFLTADIGAPPPPFGPGTETCADQFASGVHDTAISWVLSGASGAYSMTGTASESTYVMINDALTLDTQDFSMSYWWKANATNPTLNSQYVFGMVNEGDSTTPGFQLVMDNADTDDINIYCAEDDLTVHNFNTQITPSTSTVWHRFDGVYDDTANTYTMYVDGAQVNQLTSFAITVEDMRIGIGRGTGLSCPGQTYGDEARFVQGTALSADWVAAEYESMIDSTVGGANFWKSLGVETVFVPGTQSPLTIADLRCFHVGSNCYALASEDAATALAGQVDELAAVLTSGSMQWGDSQHGEGDDFVAFTTADSGHINDFLISSLDEWRIYQITGQETRGSLAGYVISPSFEGTAGTTTTVRSFDGINSESAGQQPSGGGLWGRSQ